MAVSYGMSHLGRHCIAAQQLSLTKMYALLEMQHANGAIISYDHASADAVKLWLQAGQAAATFSQSCVSVHQAT